MCLNIIALLYAANLEIIFGIAHFDYNKKLPTIRKLHYRISRIVGSILINY